MTTWAEISELSKQLKELQSKSSGIKLTERTWIDIIRQTEKRCNVKYYHTSDGRTFLTEDQILSEIDNEIEAHNGRVPINEVASMLNIDSEYVESLFPKLNQPDELPRVFSAFNDIFSTLYLYNVSNLIRDRLEEKGFVSIVDLTRNFNLPLNNITSLFDEDRWNMLRCRKDNEMYYTDEFLALNKARIRGFLSAALAPISLTTISMKLSVPERLIGNLIESLISSGALKGSLSSGRSTFIPHAFSSAQSSYFVNFFNQNGFLDFDQLRKFAINDPAAYVCNNWPDAVVFTGVAISKSLKSQIHSILEEALSELPWLASANYLPSSLKPSDTEEILQDILADMPVRVMSGGAHVCTNSLLKSCLEVCDEWLTKCAEKAAADKAKQQASGTTETLENNKKSQLSKATSSKNMSVGGRGGREVKTKANKKKYMASKGKKVDDFDEQCEQESSSFNLMAYLDADEVAQQIEANRTDDIPADLVADIAEFILPELVERLAEKMDSVVVQNETPQRRVEVTKLAETVNSQLQALLCFEQGVLAIENETLRAKLLNHLMRSQCVAIFNQVGFALASFYDLKLSQSKNEQVSLATSRKSTKKKGKKRGKADDDSSADEDRSVDKVIAEDVSANEPAIPPPNQWTPEMRKKLMEQLSTVSQKEIPKLLDQLKECDQLLRSQTVAQTGVEVFLTHLEFIAIDCLGMQLPCLFRKKADKSYASELLVQMEQQFEEVSTGLHSDVVNTSATLSLVSSCVFSQVICNGWPICASGKIVPDLAKWINETLDTSTPKTSSKGVKFLKDKKVGPMLLHLTEMVVALVKGDREEKLLLNLEATVSSIKALIPECRKVMHSK